MHPTTTTRQLGPDHGSGKVTDATGLPRSGANAAAVAAERDSRLGRVSFIGGISTAKLNR